MAIPNCDAQGWDLKFGFTSGLCVNSDETKLYVRESRGAYLTEQSVGFGGKHPRVSERRVIVSIRNPTIDAEVKCGTHHASDL